VPGVGDLAATLAEAVVVFVSTNVDDIVLLSVFFADRQLRLRAIVAGHYIGIGVLVLVSAVVGAGAVVAPSGWTSVLGAVPLVLGLYKGAWWYGREARRATPMTRPRSAPVWLRARRSSRLSE
jgi:cadmium resistance protein CadD (predicted permease)